MRYIKAALTGLFLGILICLLSCAGPRLVPRYSGIDPKLEPYVQEYVRLAKYHGITFSQKISMGMTDLPGNIVGQCYYGIWFREIEIDKSYWLNSTETGKIMLLWHELGHCACDRGHDYALNKEYTTDKNLNSKDGFFSDFCPKSLMYPVVIEDSCVLNHYSEYTNELFDRCEPW